ncbi:hypothetical protein [Micromonospora echinaurantiaca]|uniref:hypothetical protein n=1 Tax=Micromonospora echinaurantiaca TaxID=47857 RepID=UPI00341706A4
MRYLPPPAWPPSRLWPPPADDWMPPDGWEPRRGLPIAPDGDGYIVPPRTPEKASPELTSEEQEEIHLHRVTRMLGMWAREVQRAAHSYYQAALKAAWTDRAIEYMEDWSPDESDLAVALEETWIRGYHLIMGASQMAQWLSVYRRLTHNSAEGGADPEEHDRLLTTLRHTIEHLSDARLSEFAARRDPANTKWKSPNIDKLPGGGLFLGFAPGNHEYVFGLVEVKVLFEQAAKYSHIDTPTELLDYEPSDIDYERMAYGYDDEL